MPIPQKRKNESDDNFINRCMGDATMKREYPGPNQRLAVCNAQLEKKEKK